jgi:hypothetical protein
VLAAAHGDNFKALDPSTPELRTLNIRQLKSEMCGFGYIALVVE